MQHHEYLQYLAGKGSFPVDSNALDTMQVGLGSRLMWSSMVLERGLLSCTMRTWPLSALVRFSESIC